MQTSTLIVEESHQIQNDVIEQIGNNKLIEKNKKYNKIENLDSLRVKNLDTKEEIEVPLQLLDEYEILLEEIFGENFSNIYLKNENEKSIHKNSSDDSQSAVSVIPQETLAGSKHLRQYVERIKNVKNKFQNVNNTTKCDSKQNSKSDSHRFKSFGAPSKCPSNILSGLSELARESRRQSRAENLWAQNQQWIKKNICYTRDMRNGVRDVWIIDRDFIPYPQTSPKSWVHEEQRVTALKNSSSNESGGASGRLRSEGPLTTLSNINSTSSFGNKRQENTSSGPIWCLALNSSKEYLAAGTRKGLVCVWQLVPPHRNQSTSREGQDSCSSGSPSSVLRRHSILCGHTAAAVHVAWSQTMGSTILLSCGLDKSVRIWSLCCSSPLAILRCLDWPICACFVPYSDDKLMVVGSLDGTVHLWKLRPQPTEFECADRATRDDRRDLYTNQKHFLINVCECEVQISCRLSDVVTCVSVSPRGTFLAVGTRRGSVSLYSLKTFRFLNEFDCRNRKGKHSGGEKVSSIDWLSETESNGGSISSAVHSSSFICVTTNDSRVRLIPIADPSKSLKLKGHVNEKLMLRAQIDPSGRFVISPSEDNYIYVWDIWESCRKGAINPNELPKQPSPGSQFNLMWVPPLHGNIKKRPTESHCAKFRAVGEGQDVMATWVDSAMDCRLFGPEIEMASKCCVDPDAPNSAIVIFTGTKTGEIQVQVAILGN